MVTKVIGVKKNERLGYVPSLDGLRAVAIILVLLTHANFQLGHNGIIGVDIFFALSGFLITTLLLEEKDLTGKISIKGFYIRRAFRLYPALLVLLVFITLYGIYGVVEPNRSFVLLEALSAGLYLYNLSWLWGWGNNGLLLLSHTWTLAVEEQFYLIWPWVAILFLNKRLSYLATGLAIVILLVFTLKITNKMSLVGISVVHEAIFMGCLAAILRWRGSLGFNIPDYVILMVLGGVVVIGIFPFPWYFKLKEMGGRSIFAVLTLFIIITVINNPQYFASRILASPVLVWVGKISYSLYLWHVPIFKLFKYHSTFSPAASFVLKFIVTFIVAIISWILIERKATQFGRKLSRVKA